MINFRKVAGAALLGLASLTVVIAPANAASCRNAAGHYTKCVKAPAPAPAHKVAAAPRKR